MEYNYIKVSELLNFTIITINRPYLNNKINGKCMDEMVFALDQCEKNNDCKVVIFTGIGSFFCGGGDLGDYKNQSTSQIVMFGNSFINLHTKIVDFSKPVVAAVNGDTLGGGLSLLEVCDYAVSTKNAVFAIPEINYNLAPMMSLMGVKNHLSRKQSMEMVLLGKILTAQQALELGLVNHVCDDEEVVQKTIDIMSNVLDKNLFAFSMCKKFYNQSQTSSYRDQLEIGLSYLIPMLKGD